MEVFKSNVSLEATPTSDTHIVNKKYTDTKIDKNSIATTISSASTNASPSGAKAVYDLVQKIMIDTLKKQNPIGKLYITTDDTNPSTILGFGTWVRVAQNMTLWGANANGQSGSTKSAGLPNITGSTFCDLNVSGTETSGAFNGTQSSLMNGLSTGGILAGVGVSTSTVKFNASRSNSIYGNSTTVQPPALVVNIWKRTA